MKRFQRACLPWLWAGTRVRGPCPGLSSEDPGLAGGLLPFLGRSFPGLLLVLPVSLGAGLAAGLVRDGGSRPAFYTDPEELGLVSSFLGAAAL